MLVKAMVEDDFRAVMSSAGLSIKERILADGRLYRFHVHGDKSGAKNGWYVLYGGDIPAGAYGCWKRGISYTWRTKSLKRMTTTQQKEYYAKIAKAREKHEQEKQKRQSQARHKGEYIWRNASVLKHTNHPYLTLKQVRNYGLKLYKGSLVIPLRDEGGILQSLQFIDDVGNKRFLSGGKILEGYFPIGEVQDTLCIAEGYATAASIHENTGHAVAVAFNAGNLKPVATALRRKFPDVKIIICADNDAKTDGNPGVKKAREAALAIEGFLAVPPRAGDFNDLMCGGCA